MSIFKFFRKGDESSKVQPSVISSAKPTETKENHKETEPDTSEATTDNKPDEIKRVHNLIILDESGSMHSIYQPALSGVNETLQTIRNAQNEHKEQRHSVSLVAFDTEHYNRIYANTPAENAVDITKDQYRPNGCTPLFDAMGRSINELRPHVNADDVVLVTVITDGYENASREYDGKAIKSLIDELKSQGWVFTYIGANQDVEAVAASMSIDNHLAFEANASSTKAMFEKERRSREIFLDRLSKKEMMEKLSKGYFDNDDDQL